MRSNFLQSGSRKESGLGRRRVLCGGALFFGLCLSALAQTTWNSASDGVWTNDAAWTAGVPNANTVYLTNNAASYTVTVDATPVTPYGGLTITNAAGNTTRLNVNAPGFTSTNGLLTFGRGAEVYVNSGGVMCYTGRTVVSPFVTVRDGGVWRLNGGKVDFTNLRRATPSSGSSYAYIGLDSTGRLEVASGEFSLTGIMDSTETNFAVGLFIGVGTDGRGTLEMTGGKVIINRNDTSVGCSIGSGTRSIGTVSLSGDALLLASNRVDIGLANSTGIVTIAGSSVLRVQRLSRVYMAAEDNAQGTITVRENGNLDLIFTDSFQIGGGTKNRGVLNVEGGCANLGGGATLCRSRTSVSGYGEINLSAGEVNCGKNSAYQYGLTIATAENTTGLAQARVNVAGGLLDLGRALKNNVSSRNGLLLGLVGAVAGGVALGEMNISGGTITNSGQFILGTGLGATGTVVQTGGNVRQGMTSYGVTCYPMTVGWGGGGGSYTLSGGTFVSAKNVYVGGVTASDLGYTPTGIVFANNSAGTLRVDGGSFAVTNANLYLGRYGTGTLILGSNGVCSAKDVVLSSNMQSNVSFEFGADGIGTLTALGSLTISDGAKLAVDSTAYRGSAVWTKLVDCATRTNAFAQANITVTGKGIVRQDRNEDIWFFIQRGTMIFVN